jgi:hypothetical protein
LKNYDVERRLVLINIIDSIFGKMNTINTNR